MLSHQLRPLVVKLEALNNMKRGLNNYLTAFDKGLSYGSTVFTKRGNLTLFSSGKFKWRRSKSYFFLLALKEATNISYRLYGLKLSFDSNELQPSKPGLSYIYNVNGPDLTENIKPI